MNKNQETLINLLYLSIKNEKILDVKRKNINWDYIISESKRHVIYPLLFPVIKDIKTPSVINNAIKEQWTRDTFNTAIHFSNQYRQFSKVLKEFTNANIPVLVLKGMILRNYYPVPDLRTMSDADILIHQEDIENTKTLLTSMGYIEAEVDHPAHITFVHKNFNPIEVHWKLADSSYIGDISYFESHIWNNAVEEQVGGMPLLHLCNEDFLMHLCIHMAVHIRCGGFGLRQLCDLVLFLESEFTKINWKSFSVNIKRNGIEKFTATIFNACKRLFNMQLPDELKIIYISEKEIKMLINDIFDSGVFGKTSLDRVFANGLINTNIKPKIKTENTRRNRSVINIICPPVNSLSGSYTYAKKYKILTPIAWLHHFFAGMFNKDYTIFDKIDFLFLSTLTYKKRSKLIKNLEL